MRAWACGRVTPPSIAGTPARWKGPHDRRPSPRFRAAAGIARPAQPAGIVVAAAAYPPAPPPRRLPADAHAVRHRAEGRDAVAHPLVADLAAVAAGGIGDLCRRRTTMESIHCHR